MPPVVLLTISVLVRFQAGAGNGTDWNNIAQWDSVSFVRGNTYYLQSGTYTASKNLNIPGSGSTYIYLKKATSSAHGTDTGWVASYGSGTVTFSGVSLLISTDYWDIDGITGGGPGAWTSGHGIVFTSDVGVSGQYIDFGAGLTLTNLAFHHIAFVQTGTATTSSHEMSGFYQNGGTLNNFVTEYCYFNNLTFLPWFLRSGTGWTIQYNYSGLVCGHSVLTPRRSLRGSRSLHGQPGKFSL